MMRVSNGVIRVSMVHYNTVPEVDPLITAFDQSLGQSQSIWNALHQHNALLWGRFRALVDYKKFSLPSERLARGE